MNDTIQTASDMTGHTALLFIIVAIVFLIGLGIVGDLQKKWRDHTEETMIPTTETMLNEQQVFQCCKYLREAMFALRAFALLGVHYDVTPDLQNIADLTGRMLTIGMQASVELHLPHLMRTTWREVDDFELAAMLRDAGILTQDDCEWVCPFRGETFEEAMQLMHEEELRR